MTSSTGWFGWPLGAAVFAALTAIFAKLGLKRVDSDIATLLRTAIVLVVPTVLVVTTSKWSDPRALSSCA